MGKKNRNTSKHCEEGIASDSSSALKRKGHHDSELLNQNITECDTAKKVKKIKKNKKLSNHNDKTLDVRESKETTAESNVIDNNKIPTDVIRNTKTKKLKKKNEAKTALNKKIIFEGDNDVEDGNNVKETDKTNLKYLQGEEAEVKEEDIDAYCEGISEEDNVQYENWVKLFEAQFSSSKNKKKSNKT